MKRIMIVMLVLASMRCLGQLNPMGSQYFQNRYLVNPAMAGISEGAEFNAAFKAQWTAIEGSPVMESLSAVYRGVEKKVGFGLSFYNEKAGVIKSTSVKATYAFHLPLDEEESFADFGLSAALMSQHIDINKVKGDLEDGSLNNFNNRGAYFDGDFGAALRIKRFTIQGAVPNLKRFLNRDLEREVADRSLYMSSASYRFPLGQSEINNLEPLVMYRGVQHFKSILDVGINLVLSEGNLQASAVYHSTNSVTIGVGTVYKGKLKIQAYYTTDTSELKGYSNGEFEIALSLKF